MIKFEILHCIRETECSEVSSTHRETDSNRLILAVEANWPEQNPTNPSALATTNPSSRPLEVMQPSRSGLHNSIPQPTSIQRWFDEHSVNEQSPPKRRSGHVQLWPAGFGRFARRPGEVALATAAENSLHSLAGFPPTPAPAPRPSPTDQWLWQWLWQWPVVVAFLRNHRVAARVMRSLALMAIAVIYALRVETQRLSEEPQCHILSISLVIRR